MISALISFLGGSAFRMLWGEIAAWFTAKQEHTHELERMRLQGDLDAAQHARNLEAQKLQADLGIKEIAVKSEADLALKDLDVWGRAIESANKATGVVFVDLWNGSIRPLVATIAVVLWVLALNAQGWRMTEWDKEIVGVVFGFFFASRELAKRGK